MKTAVALGSTTSKVINGASKLRSKPPSDRHLFALLVQLPILLDNSIIVPQPANGCFAAMIFVTATRAFGRQVPNTAADSSHSDRKLTNSIWNALSQEESRVAHVAATWAFDKRMLSQVYGAPFLLRAVRARGRNLRSPRITYST
jgi:hypothetical protein